MHAETGPGLAALFPLAGFTIFPLSVPLISNAAGVQPPGYLVPISLLAGLVVGCVLMAQFLGKRLRHGKLISCQQIACSMMAPQCFAVDGQPVRLWVFDSIKGMLLEVKGAFAREIIRLNPDAKLRQRLL
jgi:hypothetical protein